MEYMLGRKKVQKINQLIQAKPRIVLQRKTSLFKTMCAVLRSKLHLLKKTKWLLLHEASHELE